MESVFEIASREELADLFGDEEDIALARMYGTPGHNLAMLARVYHWRGDTAKADACLAQIEDKQDRLDNTLALYERVQ